jgi:hypothetical protein
MAVLKLPPGGTKTVMVIVTGSSRDPTVAVAA